MRRLAVAAVVSAAVAVLTLVAATVYGFVRPGPAASWRDGGSLIVEKESGTRYVYVDGVLHPVVNWASARLILGSSSPTVVRVAKQSLQGVPRGLPVGILGAPDDLPDPTHLRAGPWTLCSQLAPTGDGAYRPASVLRIGWAPPEPSLGEDGAVLVAGSDGVDYLLWRSWRLPVASAAVRNALGLAYVPPVPVGAALLNAVAQGPVLGPVAVDQLGAPGPALGDRTGLVGQVYVVEAVAGAQDQYYLLTAGGLMPLTPVQAAIQLATAPTWLYPDGTVTAVPLSSAEAAAQPTLAARAEQVLLPATVPRVVHAVPEQTQICSIHSGSNQGSQTPSLVLRFAEPVTSVVSTQEPVAVRGGPLADAVLLEPATGALVRAEPSPGAGTGTIYLVTDVGIRYPVADVEAADALGYGGVDPTPVPAEYVALMPTGPVLSRSAALQEQLVSPDPS